MGIVLLAIEWCCAAAAAVSLAFAATVDPWWLVAAAASAGIGLWARSLAVRGHHDRRTRRWLQRS